MTAELAFSGIAALSRRIGAREISPIDLVEGCLARVDALDARLGAFAAIAPERAREAARAAVAEKASGRSRGPLHGIPFALADAIDARGLPAFGGRAPPERDATVAARLADHGAILLGKVHAFPIREAAPPGAACRSPWDPRRSAGGPSPGSAVAVAAGLVPFALSAHGAEADTAAAECGVTALRPTYGVLSRRGAALGSFTLATLGIVARSAEDCALVLDDLAGADPRDASSVGAPPGIARIAAELPKGVRVGVVSLDSAAPEAREPFNATQEAFRAAGALVAPAPLPEAPWSALAALLFEAEGAVVREDVLGAPAAGADAVVGTAADYVRAMRARGEAQRAIARLLERHDLLLAPAPEGGAPPDALACAVALCGLPAVTLPIGLVSARPIAARLVAPPLEEARLLSSAAVFQGRTTHHLQRPPLSADQPLATAR